MSLSFATPVGSPSIVRFQGVLNPKEINEVTKAIQIVFKNFTERTDLYNLGAFQHAETEVTHLATLCHQNPKLTPTSLEYFVLLARWSGAISSRLTQVNTQIIHMARSVKGL